MHELDIQSDLDCQYKIINIDFDNYLELFKDIDSYEKYEVILDKPNTSFNYRHSIYYTVSFTTKTGKKIIKDTAPIFSDWGNIASLHDYNNKKVNIAYNEKNDTLIVLSK